MLRELPKRDRLTVRLRFHDDLTQREIAERLECSQLHVSRTLRRIFDRLAACHERGSIAA
jgi:RNA polymerase sigma-B factor